MKDLFFFTLYFYDEDTFQSKTVKVYASSTLEAYEKATDQNPELVDGYNWMVEKIDVIPYFENAGQANAYAVYQMNINKYVTMCNQYLAEGKDKAAEDIYDAHVERLMSAVRRIAANA